MSAIDAILGPAAPAVELPGKCARRRVALSGWLAAILGAWILVCLAWIRFRWGGETGHLVFGICYDIPIGPLLVALCMNAARCESLTARTRRGWFFIGLSYFSYWLGNCLWNYYEGFLGTDPFPSAADAFFLALYPLVIYGLTRLTDRLPTRRERIRFALDCAIATVGALGLLWYGIVPLIELDTEQGWFNLLVSAAYPTADALLFVAVISTMLKRRTTAHLAPLAVLTISFISMMIADVLFLIPAVEGEYASGGVVDVFFLLSFGLTAYAAYDQVRLANGQGRIRLPAPEGYSFQAIPYLAVGGVYAALMWSMRDRLLAPDGMLAAAAMLTTGLVIVRQVLAHRENAELSAAHAAQAAEARYGALVKNSTDIVLVVDEKARIAFVTPSVARQLGLDPQEMIGRPLADWVHPADQFVMRHFCRDLNEDPGLTGPIEWRLRAHDATWRDVEVIGSNLTSDPSVRGLVLNARDITERKRLEEQLKHLAFTDTLTLLANRNLFNEHIAHALAQAQPGGARPSLIFVDLDNFKRINDSLGHETGDRLLSLAARRLMRATRDTDTVARLGGDEFAVLVCSDHEQDYVQTLAARLVETLSVPYEIGGKRMTVSASAGVATAPPGATAQELMRNADLAMYRAKSRGKRCFEVFEPSMYAAVMHTLDLEIELTRALDEGAIVPYYQPVVDLQTEAIIGFEALVRWHHPQRGTIEPAAFVHIAEESGLIARLGRTVLHDACAQAARWMRDVRPNQLSHIAVNLSARQLEMPEIVDDVRSALAASGLPPRALVLEITESLLVHDVPAAAAQLARIKELGVRIALDDFGTGYSSLAHLHRFPIDILKIDRSFVADLRNDECSELVRAVVALGQALNMDVIAEGVEKTEHLVRLRRLGCGFAQGFYFAQPEPAHVIDERLHAQAPALRLVTS
ncbi:MAG: putative bifunctional diguanylate cyclase/phosphodiesterase [Gammaproteobacteria bacterium]